MNQTEYIEKYLAETAEIAKILDRNSVEKIFAILLKIKLQKGRIFYLGAGGSAASASHTSNDFNKIAEIETLCLTDNIGLLTALVNDEGWDSVFMRELQMHQLTTRDCLFIYSVGGGSQTVSKNLVLAIDYAKKIGGVVGKDTGATVMPTHIWRFPFPATKLGTCLSICQKQLKKKG